MRNKMIPPKVQWVDIERQGNPTVQKSYRVFGLVNIGTPHKKWCTFEAKWFDEYGWADAMGDHFEGRIITHYLIET